MTSTAHDAYAAAGVDINAGEQLVHRISEHAQRTHRAGVLDGLGGFAAGVELDVGRYRSPVLFTATDGVGTKLRIAALTGRWSTIGQDLVAMCVNDIATTGADPLVFLDYLATSALDVATAEQVVAGIADGCLLAGCSLVGGETAEMPGMYRPGELDLAGFCVGVVERDQRLPRGTISAGDQLVAIASSGIHSNGYSLVRNVLLADDGSRSDDDLRANLNTHEPRLNRTLADELLEPTRIYSRTVTTLCGEEPVSGLVHITGGGLIDNPPRVLADGLGAVIDTDTWSIPPIFELLRQRGELDAQSMFRTFNMGIGMLAVVPADRGTAAVEHLVELGEHAWIAGAITSGSGVELAGAAAAS